MRIAEPNTAVSTTYRIVVHSTTPTTSHHLVEAAHQAGITHLESIQRNRLYFIKGEVSEAEVERLATAVLADPVTEQFTISDLRFTNQFTIHNSQFTIHNFSSSSTIETTLLPGVTDPPAENLRRAAVNLGIRGIEVAATGEQFLLDGELSDADKERLATEIVANPVVQRYAIDAPISAPFVSYQQSDETVERIDFREATDDELLQISNERRLSMDLNEMRALQSYYQEEGRAATDVELEMLAQTWSEHCVHKTFKAQIEYTGPDGETEQIDGILNQYIRAATEKINKPWVHSAFVDNAGIVKFDETFDLAFKVETHNHPSALEPFGGANTGVGGCIRDVLGVSAHPIANTDVLCFGLPDTPTEDVPDGVLHPRQIAAGVIHGIEDYGNKMGIPTVNGSIHYHPGYMANPLVYVGCLGILPHGSHPTEPQAGNLVIAIGGRTGRDGLRGATFSSMEMDVETSEIAGTAVQIGHPIMEKQVQEVVIQARDSQLYNAITDCGAGGYSSAVGEMGEHLGATIQLKNVTLKYPGLRPWEIWLSEAQERMVLAVPPEKLAQLQVICDGQDVELIELGTFGNDGRIQLFYGDTLVGDLSMAFLHDGIPQRQLVATWRMGEERHGEGRPLANSPHRPIIPSKALLKLLAHPDIRSKEDVIRRYDHEVQGGTAVKPLVGITNQGPSDATVIVPHLTQKEIYDFGFTIYEGSNRKSKIVNRKSTKGVALGNGIRPNYTTHDPYNMAWAAVDEAMRNVVAVGADPDQVSILDNFCWGNPNLPDRLGALVRCSQGCYDAAVVYQTPFISGKDSLNNEYTGADGEKHAIPGTLLVSALGMVPDVAKTVTMDLKQAGNVLFVVGETRDELLGGHYLIVNCQLSIVNCQLPTPVFDALSHFRALHNAMQSGLVRACHDCSEGGLAVTLAEMGLAGGLGATVDVTAVSPQQELLDEAALFSESLSRFVVEVSPEDVEAFTKQLADVPHYQIGTVEGERLVVDGRSGQLIDLAVGELESAWRGVGEERREKREEREELSIVNRQLSIVNGQPSTGRNRKSKIVNHKSKILILHANGTNRDHDAALACELAGGAPEIVHINQLLAGERRLDEYGMMVVPGGFSYGDDLGAGVLWSLDLEHRLAEQMGRFVEDGRLLLGICNGFQTLVKAGILPGARGRGARSEERRVTLTFNEQGRFECRWVYLQPNPDSPSLFTQDLTEPIYCPVAHGEGRLMVRDEETLAALVEGNLIALTYVNGEQLTVNSQQSTVNSQQSTEENRQLSIEYPSNPNGSVANIAALCNPAGNVLGLMPHPENHIFPWQHPRVHRGERGLDGLRLFENGIKNI